MADHEEDWLYHLPAFLDQVREAGAHGIVENVEGTVEGVLYHHRGARVPGHNATFVWTGDAFELEIDAVGSRAARAAFDADREWDFYLSRAPGNAAYLAWMCDDEFRAEEAEAFDSKQATIGLGRFSFGLYLQPPDAWDELEERVGDTDAPCFLQRPSGRTLVPEKSLAEYDDVVPPELLDRPHPEHLGLVDAHVSRGQ